MKKLLGRLTYANAMATIAVFIALGGASYAAIKLPKNSVGAKQLKKNAVTPAKLSKASKAAIVGPRGPAGPAGPQGPAGQGKLFSFAGNAVGVIGATTVATLTLPAGNYQIQGKLDAVHNGTANSSRLECSLVDGATTLDFIKLRLAPNNTESALIFGVVPIQAAVTLAAPATINVTCASSLGDEIELSERKLTALSVSSIG